jgi:hypothetical protein
MRNCLCKTVDERLTGSTLWRARSATARILIAHLVLTELERTMYSSLDCLDACSNVHHGATDHGAAGNPLSKNNTEKEDSQKSSKKVETAVAKD